VEEQLDAELRFHLDQQSEEYVKGGVKVDHLGGAKGSH
jgi:hypothetical protein